MRFDFGKNTVDIEVCGKTYVVNPYSDTVLNGMKAYRETLTGIGERGDDTPESVKATCAAVAGFVDAVLGTGAYEEIFAGREPNFLDHQELVSYLVGMISAFRVKRIQEATISGTEAAKRILGMEETVH